MRRLRPHQKPAFRYAMQNEHPALFMRMRLGKTIVAIRRALATKPRYHEDGRGLHCLVVAPNSALESWQDELAIENQKGVIRTEGSRNQRLKDMCAWPRWLLLNKEGWLSIPEIAARDRCQLCNGAGKVKPGKGLCVVNRKTEACDVRIDRPSKWGNPFRIGQDGDRVDVIAAYRAYLLTQPELMDNLSELANKRIGCVCTPQLCHGDVLVDLIKKHVHARPCRACKGRGYGPVVGPTIWDHVFIDESFIRNPQAKVTEFFTSSFRDVPHRWMLTGLPNPESRLDYFNQLKWLDGEAFGHKTYWQFRAECFEPKAYGYGWRPKKGMAKAIDAVVGDRAFVLSREAAGIPDMKVYQKRVLQLPSKWRKQYDAMEQAYVRKIGKKTEETGFSVVRWSWMRQLCGGFIEKKLTWAGKIKELTTLLTGELADEQVVVWFAFDPEINTAHAALKKAGVQSAIYAGSVAPRNRRVRRASFDKGSIRVLLVQEALGKQSLQLAASSTAIYYSNSTSFDARSQSEDRILDTEKKQPLLYLDMIVENTVDQDIRDVLVEKRWRSDTSFTRAVNERMRRRVHA